MKSLSSHFSARACLLPGILAATALAALPAVAFPPGPTPVVPDGGSAPGAYPNTSVSAVNVVAKGSSEAFDGRVEISGFEGQGPIPWVCNRYNRGDFAMRLAPANPSAADAETLNKGFIDFPGSNDPTLAQNHAWRPSANLGVAIPTARQNGPIDWGDGQGGFYPTVSISPASSGYGYDMVSGGFGTGQLDIEGGRAGGAGGTHASPEANFSYSVSWFPFDAGWIGGNVGNPNPTTGAPAWDGVGQHSAGLVPRLMTWSEFPAGSGTFGGLGMLRLPGVDALANGMIFTTSSQGNSDVNIVGVAPVTELNGASGWIVTVREDSAATGEEIATSGQFQFEFVYVPYNAKNLIGGYIEGASGNSLQSAGAFTIVRSSPGTYELAIAGKTASSGTLLLQVADVEEGTSVPMASRAFLSYEYNAASGKFVIQSRKVTSDAVSDLTDASFYFTWVDFANPVAPPDGPRLRQSEPVIVTDFNTINSREAVVAVNTDEPEILVVTIDQRDQTTGPSEDLDPTTGDPAFSRVLGYFYDPRNLTLTRPAFFITGNSRGNVTPSNINRLDVKYNPVSHQYIVVCDARQYDPNGPADNVMIARVNPNSVAGADSPVAGVFVYDGLANGLSYDDVTVAVSTRNGNFLVVAEHKVAGEGEGAVGALFSKEGTVLTPIPNRLDLLQGAGDEDDPDVVYLPGKDVFLYIANTDLVDFLRDRMVGSIIQTTPDAGGNLQINGPEQPLATATEAHPVQGHAAAIENPFNGELITVFDNGNETSTGEISYRTIGAGPAYAFTEARPQDSYLDGVSAGNPFLHRHPQLAVDPNSGVFVVSYPARGSTVGYPNAVVYSVLDSAGTPMPSPLGAPYFLIDTVAGPIDSDPCFHSIKYDPFSDSFMVVANAGGIGSRTVYLASLTVTSSHLTQPTQPTLTITRSGANLVISAATGATDFNLESTVSLAPATWQTVTGVVRVGDSLTHTIPLTTTGNLFFRLKR